MIGPENWKTIAPKCGGQHQSPIEISIEVTVDKPLDSPLVMAMPGADPTVANKLIVQGKLINNGKAIGYNIDTAATAVKLSGGILGADTFTLRQFHFHFGCEGEMGSEHTLEGERFAGEVRNYCFQLLIHPFIYIDSFIHSFGRLFADLPRLQWLYLRLRFSSIGFKSMIG